MNVYLHPVGCTIIHYSAYINGSSDVESANLSVNILTDLSVNAIVNNLIICETIRANCVHFQLKFCKHWCPLERSIQKSFHNWSKWSYRLKCIKFPFDMQLSELYVVQWVNGHVWMRIGRSKFDDDNDKKWPILRPKRKNYCEKISEKNECRMEGKQRKGDKTKRQKNDEQQQRSRQMLYISGVPAQTEWGEEEETQIMRFDLLSHTSLRSWNKPKLVAGPMQMHQIKVRWKGDFRMSPVRDHMWVTILFISDYRKARDR